MNIPPEPARERLEERRAAETDGMEAEMDGSHRLEEEKMRRGARRLSRPDGC